MAVGPESRRVCFPSGPMKCACFLSSICANRRLSGSFGLLMSKFCGPLRSWLARPLSDSPLQTVPDNFALSWHEPEFLNAPLP
eukprot:1925885-Heterocapsa_arctica.AAC.1